MNLSHGYGHRVPEAEARQALDEAFEMGYRHFDTATLYGATENERLLGLALKEKRQQLLLASKCGMEMYPESGKRIIDGRPDTLRRQCEASLKRLKTDYLDILLKCHSPLSTNLCCITPYQLECHPYSPVEAVFRFSK